MYRGPFLFITDLTISPTQRTIRLMFVKIRPASFNELFNHNSQFICIFNSGKMGFVDVLLSNKRKRQYSVQS